MLLTILLLKHDPGVNGFGLCISIPEQTWNKLKNTKKSIKACIVICRVTQFSVVKMKTHDKKMHVR